MPTRRSARGPAVRPTLRSKVGRSGAPRSAARPNSALVAYCGVANPHGFGEHALLMVCGHACLPSPLNPSRPVGGARRGGKGSQGDGDPPAERVDGPRDLIGVPALRMALMAAQGINGPTVVASPANVAFAKANLAQLKPKMDAADGRGSAGK